MCHVSPPAGGETSEGEARVIIFLRCFAALNKTSQIQLLVSIRNWLLSAVLKTSGYFCAVKNTLWIFGVAIWVAFYCFANRTTNAVAPTPAFPGNSEKEISFSTITKSPLYHAFPSGGFENNLDNSGGFYPTIKTAYKSFWAAIRITEQRYASAFTQYVCISRTFLIRFRKADVLFPFHYFW